MSKHGKLQSDIVKYLTAIGGYGINIIASSKEGTPDITGCVEGKFFGIEVKVLPDVPSDLQKENLQDIEAAGGICVVAFELDDVVKAVASNTHQNRHYYQ